MTTKQSSGFLLILMALLTIAVSPAVAQSLAAGLDGGILTLEAAMSLALDHNRQLATSTLAIENAEADLANARVSRYPVFDISSTTAQSLTQMSFAFPKGAFGTFESTGPVPADDIRVTSTRRPLVLVQATITQPLSQLSRLNVGIKARAAARDIERERFDGAVQRVLANVRQLYYAIVNTDRAIVVAARTLETVRELDEVVQQRVARRVVLKADGVETHYRVAQAEQNQLVLFNTRDSLHEQLNQLLGRDLRTPFTVTPIALDALDLEDLATVTARAVERRHDVKEARLRVEQADLDRRAKSLESRPEVSLALSYQSAFNVDVLPRNYTTLGLMVSWEPWDWGTRRREVGQKVNAVQQARLALKDAEDTVVREVSASYRRLREARAQLAVVAVSEDIARERARVRIEQVKVSAALPVDGLAAQTEVAQAGARHQEALSAYWTARAQYELAIGEDVR